MGADYYKWTATFLSAVVLAASGAAIGSVTTRGVSEARVKELIRSESPYTQDRPALKLSLSQIQEKIDQLTVSIAFQAKQSQTQHDLLLKLQTIIQLQNGKTKP